MAEREAPVVIDVAHISKQFRVYEDGGTTLKDKLLFRARRKYQTHPVIRDVSFQVRRGEAVGLIGVNGCGKSTTLKMLTRILYPDSGTIRMAGRVSSMLELGAGFHPDMSGRENIYINASVFGLKKKEIDRRLQGIIDFSELEAFIDNPVRTYSSGMFMRLAFAVAVNVDADILLIDEILAVGDAGFQAKCFQKMQEIKARGTTIVIVSHNMAQIEQICERTIWIDDGYVREEGSPRDVHPLYLAWLAEKEAGTPAPAAGGGDRGGTGEARMERVTLLDRDGRERKAFTPWEPVTVRIRYTAGAELSGVAVAASLYRGETFLLGVNSLTDTAGPLTLKREGTIELRLENLPVTSGRYTLDLALQRADGLEYDRLPRAAEIAVADSAQTGGVLAARREWTAT